jgi:hypothetical protein
MCWISFWGLRLVQRTLEPTPLHTRAHPSVRHKKHQESRDDFIIKIYLRYVDRIIWSQQFWPIPETVQWSYNGTRNYIFEYLEKRAVVLHKWKTSGFHSGLFPFLSDDTVLHEAILPKFRSTCLSPYFTAFWSGSINIGTRLLSIHFALYKESGRSPKRQQTTWCHRPI